MRLRGILVGLAVWLAAITVVGGEAEPPSVPQPPLVPGPQEPESPVSNAELLTRLKAMEQMNLRLLKEVERLGKDNQKLKEDVAGISSRVKKADDAKSGETAATKKKESGLANPRSDGVIGDAEPPPVGGTRSSGARLLPNAQGVGNRRLGTIALKVFYDYGREGVGLATEDQEFQFKFRAEMQADARVYNNQPGTFTHNGIYMPRNRLYMQGRFTKPIEYQLSFQQSLGTSLSILNAFLNFNYFDSRLQFRIGRFKVPFTYEWYKLSNWQFITPERSLYPANFGLDRQEGAMLWGLLFEERLEYAVGVFDGPRNSYQDFNTAKDVSAFLNFRPFGQTESFLTNLNVGGSMDYGIQKNPGTNAFITNGNYPSNPLSQTNPNSNATLPWFNFNNNIDEQGKRELWELHMAYFYEGLSFLGAWGQGIDSYGPRGQTPTAVPVSGWSAQAAYLVTGETLNERTAIDPLRRFDLRPGRFGLGGFEPYVRYTELGLGNQVFTAGLADPNLWTNRTQLVDVGLNWYLNSGIRVYFDWEHAMFAQPVFLSPGVLQKTNNLFWMRVQIYF